MYRWSKLTEKYRPEIISDIADDKLYTFIVQDYAFKKLKRKNYVLADFISNKAVPASTLIPIVGECTNNYALNIAWEGHSWDKRHFFGKVVEKNIPCVLMHKVKNIWCPEIDTVVCFMTGDTLDIFLVHPKDLIEWDPNDV